MRAARLVPARGRASGRLQAGRLCTGYGSLDLSSLAVPGVVLAWRGATTTLTPARPWLGDCPASPSLGDLTRVDWAVVPPAGLATAGFPASGVVPWQAAGTLRLLIQAAAARLRDPGLTGQNRDVAA